MAKVLAIRIPQLFTFLLCTAIFGYLFVGMAPGPLSVQVGIAILFILAMLAPPLVGPEWALVIFAAIIPLVGIIPRLMGSPKMPILVFAFLGFCSGMSARAMMSSSARSTSRIPGRPPLLALCALVLTSGAITTLRFVNFFPFSDEPFRDWIVNCMGVLTSEAVNNTFTEGISFLSGAAFLIIGHKTFAEMSHEARAAALRRVAWAVVLSGFASNLFALWQVFSARFLVIGFITGMYTDSNALGVCSALIFPFCIGLLLTAGKRQRILLFSCALLSTVVVILARSRAGVLGIMLFLLGFALWQWRMTETDEARKRLKLHILWAFGALCLLLVIILVVQDIAGLAQMPLIGDALLVVAHPSEDSLTYVLRHRLHQWSEALRMCRQFPLTGVGLGAYIIELPNFYAVNKGQMFIIDTAGNLFLQVASELGFMGLLLLLCFGIVVLENVFNSFRVCIHRAYSAGRELLGCVGLGILVASFLFLFGAHTVFFEYNYLMAISVAVLLAWKTHPIEAQDSHSKARARSIIHRSFVAVPVIIVMGIFLVQSLGPLSIEQRRQDVGWQFEYGLYRKELWDNRFPFWWTQQESQMRVPVQGSILAFSVFCAHPDADERPVVCRVSIDGQMRGRAELTRDRWRRLKVPVNAPIGSEIVFNVAVDRTFCPCVEDNTADDRDLGVAIANIRWSD